MHHTLSTQTLNQSFTKSKAQAEKSGTQNIAYHEACGYTLIAKKTDLNAALNAIASNITRVHDEQKNKHANLQKAYAELQKKVSTLKEKVEIDDQRVRGETGPKGEKGEKGRERREG